MEENREDADYADDSDYYPKLHSRHHAGRHRTSDNNDLKTKFEESREKELETQVRNLRRELRSLEQRIKTLEADNKQMRRLLTRKSSFKSLRAVDEKEMSGKD